MTTGFLPDSFEHVIRAANVAWYEWTVSQEEVYASPALLRLFELDPTGWTRARQWEEVHPDDVRDYRANVVAAFKSGADRVENVYRFKTRSGGWRWTLDQAVLLRDATGRVTRMIGTVADITEAREHEAALTARDLQNRALIARQEATIEVLRTISDSPSDPQPAFELIARRVRELYGAHAVNVVEYDGTLMHIRAMIGHEPEATARLLAAFPRPAGMETGPGRAILSGRPSFNRDPSADKGLIQAGREVGGGSYLGVPLLHEGGVVGVLGLWLAEKGEFNESLVDIAKAFAEQAVIAISGAKTLRELRERTAELAERNTAFTERIDHQAATIDVLRAMSASPGDPQPVFDLIVRRAAEICGNPSVVLFEYDGELLHWRARVGDHIFPSLQIRDQYTSMYPMALHRGSVACRTVLDGKVIHVRDIATDPELSTTVRSLGTKSILGVPMFRDGKPIGVIGLNSMEVGGFTDTQISLLQTFGEQAVIAITSAETYRALQARTADLQESLEYQTATSDVLKVISQSTFDLQPVFDAIVRTAVRLCDADFANIANRDADDYRIAAIFTTSPDFDELMPKGNLLPVTRQNLSGRAVLSGRVVQTEDITTDPDYNMGNLEALRRIGVGTVMTVPLIRDGVAIGTLSLGRRRVQLFVPAQIDLIRTFADQAVIAIENARLLTEQKEALEQQTATAEVLGVINANPGNLAPVFDAILEKSLRICRSAFGGLAIFDGTDGQTMRSERGLTPALAEFRARNPQRGMSPNVLRMMETKRPVHQLDIREGEGYRAGHPNPRSIADLGGARTLLLVPLIRNQTVMGVIQIYRQEVRAFSDKEIALLENFAAQAVIAMETARLMTEQREALERQTATADVLAVINASPGDLAPVFDTILDKAREICGAAIGTLTTFDGELFRAVALQGFTEGVPDIVRQGFRAEDSGALQALTRGDRFVRHSDVRELGVGDWGLNDNGRTIRGYLVERSGVRSALFVPLRKDGTLLGSISAYRTEVRPFSEKDLELLENFAAQAVIAMENARLLNEIKQRQGELDVTFESMGDGVALFDETHHLAAWNQNFQDMLDVPTDIVADHPTFADYIRYLADRGEYGPEPGDMVRRLLAQPGQRASFERTRPNGQTIHIRTNPTPTGGFVVMYTDITERKRAEEALRAARDAAENALRELKIAQANLVQSEKMASLGQLTAGIAHEIKNPLNFVNNFAALSVDLLAELHETAAPGFAALTDDQRADVEDVSAMLTTNLRKIEEHGKRADGIVRAMLEHSRGSSGERREVDLNALVEEALNLAYHGARAQDQSFNITLQRDYGEPIAPIEVNPQDLTRVFLNICGNGFYAANRKAREPGFEPVLKITTRAVADTVEIRIRDNGPGIPPEIRDKLFQPFFTTKPTGEGTGLGLSITYDIVTKQHGGTITVDSAQGEYAEFIVTLPRHMFASEEANPGQIQPP